MAIPLCRCGFCDEGSANGLGALMVGGTGLMLGDSDSSSAQLIDRPELQYRDVLSLEVLPSKKITLAGTPGSLHLPHVWPCVTVCGRPV